MKNSGRENIPRHFYLILALFEGATVMSAELLGAKMIAPLYGSSLYIWSAVIGVTLGALATGYFMGGYLSVKLPRKDILFYILLLAPLSVAFMPIIAPKIALALIDLDVRIAAILSTMVFLFPPLVMLGMIPPLIINAATGSVNQSGKITGSVYAISTTGGVLATFLVGFYIIPHWGIKYSAFGMSVILGICSVAYLLMVKKVKVLIIFTFSFLIIFNLLKDHRSSKASVLKIRTQQDGIFSQIKVMDHLQQSERYLLLNNITQTLVKFGSLNISHEDYIHNIAIVASLQRKEGSNALICGIGGGSLIYELKSMGFTIDAVDIDSRIIDVAKQYFDFDQSNCRIIIDDARHFLRTTKTQYDVILFDLISSEVQPSYLYTLENFENMKNLLRDDGLMIINFQGYFYGPDGMVIRSVIKTLLKANLNTSVLFNPEEVRKTVADIIFIASPGEIRSDAVNFEMLNNCCKKASFSVENIVSSDEINLEDAQVFTDDKPSLESLNQKAILNWRKSSIREYKEWIKYKQDVPLFE